MISKRFNRSRESKATEKTIFPDLLEINKKLNAGLINNEQANELIILLGVQIVKNENLIIELEKEKEDIRIAKENISKNLH